MVHKLDSRENEGNLLRTQIITTHNVIKAATKVRKELECFKYEKRYALIKKMKLTLNTANKFKEGKREETGKYR